MSVERQWVRDMKEAVKCSGVYDTLRCYRGNFASHERMQQDGTYRPLCYECVKIARREGWRTRRLHTPNEYPKVPYP